MKIISLLAAVLLTAGLSLAQTATDYFNKGVAEFNYGNSTAAMENMNKAIALKPDYANALSYRGYFYNQLKEYDKAISDYLAAEKLSPNVNGYLMANPYALQGNKDEAFKWIEASLKASEGKAQVSAIQNDAELSALHADPRWDALVSKNWYSEYETLIMQVNALSQSNDLEGALKLLNKAIEMDPKGHQAYGLRAIVQYRQGNTDQALADLGEAIRIKPDKSSYYSDRAFVYNKLRQYEKALADFNKAIELDPENMVYADRALVRFGMNQMDPGVASDLKTQLDSYYKDDFNWYLLGTYAYGKGDYMESIVYITKAIKINDKMGDYYKKRGNAFFGAKQNSNALADFNMAISLNPKDGQAYYDRGTVKGETLDKEGACADWKKAQSLGYEDPNGYIRAICD
ncbi:MAG: tetratricopeptide repeat protein [Bacteroidota bacterium]